MWTYTFGCKVNQFDTSKIELDTSSDHDWVINRRSQSPQAVVINTCTVTESADKQARQLVRRIKRNHPEAKLIVTGCYAESRPEDFTKYGVTTVPIRQQHQISDHLGISQAKPKPLVELPTIIKRTRASLKMQDGCNAYCSFCILPYVRGRSKSIELPALVKLAQSYESHGYLELIVTGTHIGAYGRDLSPRLRFSDALKAILDATKHIEIRISSLEPTTLTPDIIKLFGESSRILPHFHIPMQSGSDTVLKRMNRKNRVQNYADRIEKLSNQRPDTAIGADVIVGYCGETQEEFEETRSVIEKLPLTYLHVFPYSGRPGTKAVSMEDNVPVAEKRRRVSVLRAISEKKSAQFYQQHLGKEMPVLLEKKRDARGRIMGHTSNYIPVAVEGHDRLMETKPLVKLLALERNDQNELSVCGQMV